MRTTIASAMGVSLKHCVRDTIAISDDFGVYHRITASHSMGYGKMVGPVRKQGNTLSSFWVGRRAMIFWGGYDLYLVLWGVFLASSLVGVVALPVLTTCREHSSRKNHAF